LKPNVNIPRGNNMHYKEKPYCRRIKNGYCRRTRARRWEQAGGNELPSAHQ
jgi:hypothetical protein